MVRNWFSLKHLSMAIGNFWTYCGQTLAVLCLVQDIKKKFSENFIEFFFIVKTKWPNVWAPRIFSTILNSKIFQDKKIVVDSKPFIKIIGILLLIVRFVKNSDQTIIQIIIKF